MTGKIAGNFTVTVSGKLLGVGSAELLRDRATRLISKIDPNYYMDERNFARLEYTYTWTGIPKNFGDANSLLKFLTEDIGRYLLDWTTEVKMQLIESGV